MTLQDFDLNDIHRQMLDAQIPGFPLTFHELMDVWHIGSTSAVAHRLRLLHKRGLVEVKQAGKRRYYRAVELDV